MYNQEQIVEILRSRKEELKKKYPISELAIFGSYARGDYNENSDIDILVDFNRSIGIEFISLAHDLEDIYKTKIDLICGRELKHYTFHR